MSTATAARKQPPSRGRGQDPAQRQQQASGSPLLPPLQSRLAPAAPKPRPQTAAQSSRAHVHQGATETAETASDDDGVEALRQRLAEALGRAESAEGQLRQLQAPPCIEAPCIESSVMESPACGTSPLQAACSREAGADAASAAVGGGAGAAAVDGLRRQVDELRRLLVLERERRLAQAAEAMEERAGFEEREAATAAQLEAYRRSTASAGRMLRAALRAAIAALRSELRDLREQVPRLA